MSKKSDKKEDVSYEATRLMPLLFLIAAKETNRVMLLKRRKKSLKLKTSLLARWRDKQQKTRSLFLD